MNVKRTKPPWYQQIGFFLLQIVFDFLGLIRLLAIYSLFVIVPCIVGMATDFLMGSGIKEIACGPGYYVGLIWCLGGFTIAALMILLGWLGSCWQRANGNEN